MTAGVQKIGIHWFLLTTDSPGQQEVEMVSSDVIELHVLKISSELYSSAFHSRNELNVKRE